MAGKPQKNLAYSVLLDFYGPVLTDKQRVILTEYYDEDLSLAEIAENLGITRQGVRDAIKPGEAALDDDAVVSDKVRQAGFRHMVGIGEQHDSANDGRLAFFSVRNIAARFCDIDGSEERLEL